MTDLDHGKITCMIEDVSSTGMALKIENFTPERGYPSLEQGARVDLTFAPDPVGAPETKVTAPGVIVWRSPIAFGIRFYEINDALRGVLKTIVTAALDDRVAASQGERNIVSDEQRQIMVECRNTLQKQLPNLIWTLRTEIIHRLHMKADSADQRAAASLGNYAALLESKAMPIRLTIEHDFLKGFAKASDLEQTMDVTFTDFTGTSRGTDSNESGSLQDDRQVEEDPRIAALGRATEERFKSEYSELDVRLANVMGPAFNRESDPIAPAAACHILWNGIVKYCDSPAVQMCLQDAIQKRIIPLLGELYEQIHETLNTAEVQRAVDPRR